MVNRDALRKPAVPGSPGRRVLLGRALVLFILLIGIKAYLVIGLKADLVQTHWRFVEDEESPFASTGFYLCLAQLAASLALLGARCDRLAVGSIRKLNLGLVTAGFAFALLSLANQDGSYLYQLFQGWNDEGRPVGNLSVGWLASPPYLGIYLLAYAFGYLVLVWKRREAWSPHLLALVAVVYGAANLHALQALAGELVVTGLFGFASLYSAWRSRERALGGAWHFVVLGLFACGWLVFDHEILSDKWSSRYLLFLIAICGAGYLALFLLARRSPAFPVLSHLLPFYAMGFFLLSNRAYPLAGNYSHVFVYALTTVRYAMAEAAQVALLFGAAWLINRNSPRRFGLARWLFDAGGGLLLLLAVVDVHVSRRLGTRLDWNVIVMSDDPVLLWGTISPYVWHAVGAAVALIAAYGFAIRAGGGRWINRLTAPNPRTPNGIGFCGAVSVLLTLAAPILVDADKAFAVPAANIAATSPIARALDFHRLTPEELLRESKELGIVDYDQRNRVAAEPNTPAPLNVFLVILESTFNKHLSLFGGREETQPNLRRYRERMELFPDFYAPFPNSFHARFSIFSGLYPTVEYVSYVNPHIPAPSLFEILKQQGYVNALFYSSHRDYTRFADYVGHRQLDVFYDCDKMPGRERYRSVSWGVEEACTKAAIEAELSRLAATGERFFLTYIPAAPHQPFELPDPRFNKFDTSAARIRNDFTGRYLNSLLYMDWIVAGLLDKLAELRLLDDTLVIVTGDHGEMVGEEGGQLGHGWKADPVLSNVPLIIMDPRRPGYRINHVLGSHVDLLPTILDLLGLRMPPGELYQGVSLLQVEAATRRRVYLDSYHERAMITDDLFIWNDPKGRRGTFRTYEINQNGARTEYVPIEAASRGKEELDRFVRLQRSLIRYYGMYRDSLRKTQTRSSVPAK